jgi:hypothetical protein
MVTQRLQRALQRIDEVPADQQDEIAMVIEDALAPHLERPSYAGALAGLLPDGAEEELLRLRRSAPRHHRLKTSCGIDGGGSRAGGAGRVMRSRGSIIARTLSRGPPVYGGWYSEGEAERRFTCNREIALCGTRPTRSG